MNRAQANDLEALAAYIVTVPDHQFDFGTCVDLSSDEALNAPLHVCGASGCALGWMPSLPALRGRLRLDNGMLRVDGAERTVGYFTAGQIVFGLTRLEVDAVFAPGMSSAWGDAPSGVADASEVARHIRKFLAWKEKNGEIRS